MREWWTFEWKRQEKEAHPTAAPVGDTNEVVDLVNSEEERCCLGKERTNRNPTSRAGRQVAAAAASDSRRAVQKLGNVIVIED